MINIPIAYSVYIFTSESESELFTGDTTKDNHSPGPAIRGASPQPLQEKQT